MSDDERRDVRAVVRTYRKDGEDKNVYANVGSAWVSPHASTITVQLDTLPIGKDWNGKLYINRPYEPKGDKPLQQHQVLDEARKDELPDDGDEPIDWDKTVIPF